jgi:hypothetical protein
MDPTVLYKPWPCRHSFISIPHLRMHTTTTISHNYQFKTVVTCPRVVSSDLLSSLQRRTIEIGT